MIICPMTDATGEQKRQLHKVFLESFPDKYRDFDKFCRLIDKRAETSYYSLEEGLVSALIINEMLDQKHLHIFFICVSKRHRGLGLGKKIILFLEQKMKEKGGEQITAEMKSGNEDAFRFYKRLGFHVMRGDGLSEYLRKRERKAEVQGEKIYVNHKGERIEKIVMNYEIYMQ